MIVLFLLYLVAENFAGKLSSRLAIKDLVQRAVWRDSGISPAETAVRIWKLLPRPNISEAATSQSRWHVSGKRGNVR